MSGLEWEINWINNHLDLYDSPQHVINNITKRYWIKEAKRLVKKFEDNRVTKNYHEMFDFFKDTTYQV